MSRHLWPLVLAQVADVIELAGLQIGAGRADVGQCRLGENSAFTSSTEQPANSWIKLIFLYSPEATRETISRLELLHVSYVC